MQTLRPNLSGNAFYVRCQEMKIGRHNGHVAHETCPRAVSRSIESLKLEIP